MECDLYFVRQGSVRAVLGVGGGNGGGAGSVGLPGGLPCQHTSPSHRPPPTPSPHINNQAHSTRQQLIRAPLLVIVLVIGDHLFDHPALLQHGPGCCCPRYGVPLSPHRVHHNVAQLIPGTGSSRALKCETSPTINIA